MRREGTLQVAHAAAADIAFALIRIASSTGVTLSTTKPKGTNDERLRFRCMLLTPLSNQREPSSEHHQM
jgi:hypothetical protein